MKSHLIYRLFVISLGIIAHQLAGQEQNVAGKFTGQWRNYYLGTFNQDELKDFHGLATGGKLGYQLTAGSWSAALVGYTTFNLGVQDLTLADPATNRLSRYELGLFDVNDPGKRFIAIPGEAYIQYQHTGHRVIVGRMKLVSPLINPQDGRMIPTLEQGIWYKYTSEKKLIFQLGLINAIASRSTDQFENIGASMGLYPVGRNLDGSPSGYRGNISSDYIFLSNVSKTWGQGLSANAWNYYVDNVFNSTYLKLGWQKPDKPFGIGLEWLHQQRINHGGNRMDSLTYFADRSADLIGAEVVYRVNNQKFSVGYNQILGRGRFLFPREWGREAIFTFQKRERSEGSADNQALLLTYELTKNIKDLQVRSIVSMGQQWKAALTNPSDNKYALPSYRHINIDWFFTHPQFGGIKPELLLTYKQGLGAIPDNPNFILNKVDFFQVNAIINYNF